MIEKDKAIKVVKKLIFLTQANKLEWRYYCIPTHDTDYNFSVKNAYTVQIQHLVFKLSEYTYKDWKRKFLFRFSTIKTGYKLEVLYCGSVIERFPENDFVAALCIAVKSKTVDMNKVLNEIINEDI